MKMTSTLHDLDLKNGNWKAYDDLLTSSLWTFPKRDKSAGHSNEYHGNFIPQIPNQLMRRFTRAGDIVLDFFAGSGTTLIEAHKLGRRCYGFDIKPDCVQAINQKIADMNDAEPCGINQEAYLKDCTNGAQMAQAGRLLDSSFGHRAKLTILHPPYWKIIRFSDNERCLSNCLSQSEFYDAMRLVAKNAEYLTEKGGHIALVIGDMWDNKESALIPLGFNCMKILQDRFGLALKAIIPKDIQGNERGKGKNANLWRYRHLKNGTFDFSHEYLFLFRRVK